MPEFSSASRTPIHVLVIEDHPVVRRGIRALLAAESDFVICGEAETLQAGLADAERLHPEVVVLDLLLPDGKGLDAIEVVHRGAPQARILVFSFHDELIYGERALRAGASGYLMKHEADERFVAALRLVAANRTYVSDAVKTRIVERLSSRPAGTSTRAASAGSAPFEKLTDRELVVFGLIAQGLSTREIAARLGISVKTVESHRAHICARLQLRGNAALVQHAISHFPSL